MAENTATLVCVFIFTNMKNKRGGTNEQYKND